MRATTGGTLNRSRTPFRLLLAIVLAMALAAFGCGSDDDNDVDTGSASGSGSEDDTATTGGDEAKGEITVASFNFSESHIVAHIYAKALAEAGYETEVREGLGNREVVGPALEKGEVDLYPGYAASDLEFFNKGAGEATPDADETVTKLNEHLKDLKAEALEPSGAININAFVVTKATAEKHKLAKVSDLAAVAKDLTLGGPAECPERPFCAKGLKDTYGVEFGTFRPLEPGPLTYNALGDGDIDVAVGFSTDGAIAANDFVVLEDDKDLQNADNIVPIISTSVLDDEVRELLDALSAKLTTEDLTELNKRADIDKEDPEALAEEWLKDNDFLS